VKTTSSPISLAGSQLGEIRHVCAFFNSDNEEYRVLLPFIKDGFECGDKAVHVVNPGQHHDHLRRLARIGIDTAIASTAASWRAANTNSGFPLSRIVCHMEWAADGRSHGDDLVEFESRVNDVWRRHDDAVIRTCDLAKFWRGYGD
jgi:hypothetical protein